MGNDVTVSEVMNAIFILIEHTNLISFFVVTSVITICFSILKIAARIGIDYEEGKKSYEDEMSVYDGEPVPAIQQTGISLLDLELIAANDGEIPDSAYGE